MVTTGARSEYGILRPILKEITNSKKLELYLIVTGMHLSKRFGFTINEIKKDGFTICDTVNMISGRDTLYDMSVSLGRGIISFSKIFRNLKPDINLVLGDRDEMFASAIAAYHMNIPNAHIHGGDKSQGGIDEYARHAITKISNIHFTASKGSFNRVLKMGENPKYVFNTGSPSIDEIIDLKITSKNELEKKYDLNFTGNEILMIYHPVTTETELTERHIKPLLDAIVKLEKPTIAIAPNSDAGNRIIFKYLKSYSKKHEFIKTFASIPRNDYLSMIKNCGVLVGNSSSGIIEAGYFRTPVINLGIRQKGRERGSNVIDVENITKQSIYNAIEIGFKLKKNNHYTNEFIYGRGRASKKIVRHLETIPLNKELMQKQISY